MQITELLEKWLKAEGLKTELNMHISLKSIISDSASH